MLLPQAADFLEETEVLHRAIAGLGAASFETPTQFKGWTINDVIVHLHFWNRAADLSARDPDAFDSLARRVIGVLGQGGTLRRIEDAEIAERGPALRDLWITTAREIGTSWQAMDPKRRLPWVGPSMSARSSMTARQMETWAHGFEIFDILGQARTETDRIRNIVVLGVNTFHWSHQVHGLPLPEAMPRLALTAPSGALWEFGEDASNSITGPAVDFAAVVTQTRALGDTALAVRGPVAETWMAHAQCFAGPPEAPPASGSRHRTG